MSTTSVAEMEQDPMVFAPPCPQPAFCLWENFSQTISLGLPWWRSG